MEFITKHTECAIEKSDKTQTCYQDNLPKFTFNNVSIDIVGPFLICNVGNCFLFVAIDKLIMVETLASSIITPNNWHILLQSMFFRLGCLHRFLINNSPSFTARVIFKLNKMICISTHYTTPYCPLSNGFVEH